MLHEKLVEPFIIKLCFQIKSLREELKFHKSIYDLQLSYVQSLFSVIRFVNQLIFKDAKYQHHHSLYYWLIFCKKKKISSIDMHYYFFTPYREGYQSFQTSCDEVIANPFRGNSFALRVHVYHIQLFTGIFYNSFRCCTLIIYF